MNALRSLLLLCVLSGSEKDPDGGLKNGGGKGLGERFANSASPVSKRKGGMVVLVKGGGMLEGWALGSGVEMRSGRRALQLGVKGREKGVRTRENLSWRNNDFLIPAMEAMRRP